MCNSSSGCSGDSKLYRRYSSSPVFFPTPCPIGSRLDHFSWGRTTEIRFGILFQDLIGLIRFVAHFEVDMHWFNQPLLYFSPLRSTGVVGVGFVAVDLCRPIAIPMLLLTKSELCGSVSTGSEEMSSFYRIVPYHSREVCLLELCCNSNRVCFQLRR